MIKDENFEKILTVFYCKNENEVKWLFFYCEKQEKFTFPINELLQSHWNETWF